VRVRAMCQVVTCVKCQVVTRVLAHSISILVKFRGTGKNPIAKAEKQSTTESPGTTSN
jgi:hypothetical protein